MICADSVPLGDSPSTLVIETPMSIPQFTHFHHQATAKAIRRTGLDWNFAPIE